MSCPVASEPVGVFAPRALDTLRADDSASGDGRGDQAMAETHAGPDPVPTVRVLVYSDDRTVRQAVRLALGRRPAPGLPLIEYLECATSWAVLRLLDDSRVDLAILDGEAAPNGGLGLCRQLKDEVFHAPPVLVLIGRPQDAWLATWSRADSVVTHPLDPEVLAEQAAILIRDRLTLPAGAGGRPE